VGERSATSMARHTAANDEGQSISVYVRLRPLLAAGAEGQEPVFERGRTDDGSHFVREVGASDVFPFTAVFDGEASNVELFKQIGQKTVENALEGFNATVFCYGQTGSGKTHTLTGTPTDPGIMGRASHHIFESIGKLTGERQFLLRASYLEIYNERVFDLCAQRKELKLRFEGTCFRAAGLSETIVKSSAELEALRQRGEQAKSMGVSNLNDHSSRSDL